MKKSKIQISGTLLEKIKYSQVVSEKEKKNLERFVGYLTPSEQNELVSLL